MAETNIPGWQYQDKNISSQSDDVTKYTRGDRTILYVRTDSTREFRAVGLLQGVTHSEQKQIQMIFELGSAAPIIIPGLSTGQLSLNRILLSGPDFINVIYEKNATDQYLRSLRDINKPFDLMLAKYAVDDPNETPSGTGPVAIKEAISYAVFEGCHIQSRSESISPGGVITAESVQIMYRQISRTKFTPTKII